jgi:glycosyltransferase involved in cell wall biosynthesis
LQFHILSFEGPDDYARAGGLATRVDGLSQALAQLGFETHLWFVGDPDLRGHEDQANLHLHRWAQWVSLHHPGGVYDGEEGKRLEYTASLPPYLLRCGLMPHLEAGGRAVVLAEEWQTAAAVLQLAELLRRSRVDDRVNLLWNANNTFGFERIPWDELSRVAQLTTVSRYMRQRMWTLGMDPLVIPNGLAADAFDPPDSEALAELHARLRGRTVLTKMARWDAGKRWLTAVEIAADTKARGWRPLLIARGGVERHGEEVLATAGARGLRVVQRQNAPDLPGLMAALSDVRDVDVVSLQSPVAASSGRVLFRGSDAVLANSAHEPFGLVGLETMAASGVVCTGGTGEEYAFPGHNSLVLETDRPDEFAALFARLRTRPGEAKALRRAARTTALGYSWTRIVDGVLLPRIEMLQARRLRDVRCSATCDVPQLASSIRI